MADKINLEADVLQQQLLLSETDAVGVKGAVCSVSRMQELLEDLLASTARTNASGTTSLQ